MLHIMYSLFITNPKTSRDIQDLAIHQRFTHVLYNTVQSLYLFEQELLEHRRAGEFGIEEYATMPVSQNVMPKDYSITHLRKY